MIEVANALALVSLSVLFGSIVFFSAGTAPVVFRALDEASAGRFLRALFPRYYLVLLFAALVAAIGLAPSRAFDAADKIKRHTGRCRIFEHVGATRRTHAS